MVLEWEWGKLWGNTPFYLKICYRIGSTVAVKSGQLGGKADIFMPMFSADTLGFAVAI